jgi:hypothetical protein
MSSNLTPYNFTITDQSPLFQYTPFRDGPISNGWTLTYQSELDPGTLTHIGSGVSNTAFFWISRSLFQSQASSHSTTFAGATVQVNWNGTAIYVYGDASGGVYTITVDNEAQTPGSLTSAGLLFSQQGMTYGYHTLLLTVKSGTIALWHADITVGMGEVG